MAKGLNVSSYQPCSYFIPAVSRPSPCSSLLGRYGTSELVSSRHASLPLYQVCTLYGMLPNLPYKVCYSESHNYCMHLL